MTGEMTTTRIAPDTSPPQTSAAPSGMRLVFLLLVVASAGYIARTCATVIAPQLIAEFGVSLTRLGVVFSAFLVGYTVCQVPSGWLADRISAHRLFLALALGWTVLMLAMAAVRGSSATAVIALLVVIRVILGVVAAPTYPASARTVAAAVAPRHQARANGVVLASIGIGSAVTPLLIGPISEHVSWRVALLVVALITAAAAALWGWFAPASARVLPPPPPKKRDPRLDALDMMAAVENRNYRLAMRIANRTQEERRTHEISPLKGLAFRVVCASYFLQGYVGYIFVFWSFLYLREVRHFSLPGAAIFTALPMIATIFAIPLGGALSDAAVQRFGPTWGRRSLPLAALSLAGVFLMISAFTPSATMAVVCLSICTVLVLSTEGPYWATVNHLAHDRGGLAGGIMNFGSNLGGMISPVLTPWIAERVGWGPALALAATLSIVAGLLWLGVHVRRTEPALVDTAADRRGASV